MERDVNIERVSVSTIQVVSWIVGLGAVIGVLAWGWVFYALTETQNNFNIRAEAISDRLSNLENGTTTRMSSETRIQFQAMARDYDDRFASINRRIDEIHRDTRQ